MSGDRRRNWWWSAFTACWGVLVCASVAAQRVPQGQWVYCVKFSPDGKQILSGGAGRRIQLWDVKTGRELQSFSHPGWLHTVAFSPDGKRCLSGTRNRTMRLWDLVTGKMLREFNHRAWVETVLFLPDGKRCISVGGDDKGKGEAAARVWDLETGRELRTFKIEASAAGKHGNWLNAASLSADGKTLAGAGPVTTLWNVETGEVAKKLPGHTPFTWEVALSPDGETCVTAGGDSNLIRVIRVKDGRVVRTIRETTQIRSLAISPDGKLFAAGVLRGTITFYSLRTGKRRGSIKAHGFIVSSLDFSPDGKLLVSGSFDGTMKLWNVRTGGLIRTIR